MQSEAENYAAEQLANLQKIYAAEQLANAKSLGQLPLRSTASSVNCLFGQPPPTFGIDSASSVNRLNTVQYTSPGDGSQYHLQLAQDPSGSLA